MSKLVFLDWTGREQTFDFVGWNSGRAAIHFLDSTAFVLDASARRQALQLRLPFLKPARYQRDPFPQHAPTRIEKLRLLPPPCRASKKEAEDLLNFIPGRPAMKYAGRGFTIPASWEIIYGDALYPKPEDEPELKAALKRSLKTHGSEYKRRKAEVSDLEGKEREDQEKFIEQRYNGPRGVLHTTLATVKSSNVDGIRDDILHRRWATAHGLDLRDMGEEKQAFLQRWRELTENVIEVRATPGGGTMSKRVQNWAGWHDREQELLALVVYRIHFDDGGRFWLSNCQLRDLQTVTEKRECDELLAVRNVEASSGLIASGEPLPGGFQTLKRAVELTERSDRWIRGECKVRGWSTAELTLERIAELEKEGRRRDGIKSRAMRRLNDKTKTKREN